MESIAGNFPICTTFDKLRAKTEIGPLKNTFGLAKA